MTGERSNVRVVLVDDHTIVREALSTLLCGCGWIEVVGQAGDTPQALSTVARQKPDVLVLDYSIPGGGALPVIEQVVRSRCQTRIIVLTVHESIHYAVRVLEAGAHGYVIKSSAVEELLEAIRSVRRDEVYVTPQVSHKVIHSLRRPRRDRVGVEALSAREFELLRLLGSGMSLRETSESLNISPSTASTYRTRLMSKLELASTAELIRFAIENDVA